jgi:hypothetical protein
MTPQIRHRQAKLQDALIRSLVGGSDPPRGLDADRVAAAAAALRMKRARGVARAWPQLAVELGARFASEFDQFARAVPIPRQGGPLADGLAFARWQAARGALLDSARIELLSVSLRFRFAPEGIVGRRGPRLGWVWLPQGRTMAVAFRWWPVGEWWLRVRPFGLGLRRGGPAPRSFGNAPHLNSRTLQEQALHLGGRP